MRADIILSSHGRPVSRRYKRVRTILTGWVDGKPWDVRHVLYDADLCGLLSDEDPLTRPAY
jgi:hypothetical protein